MGQDMAREEGKPDICTIVNTLRLPQKEDRRNFSVQREKGGNAAVTEMVPIITKGNDRRSSSMPLLGRLILHPSRNSGRSDLSAWTAREISSRSGLATLETIAIPDLSSYFTITVLLHGALRNYAHPSLFLVMFSRGRGLIRTLIRDDLSELDQARSTDARDP
ncbi:hypothetical protein G5I_13957 [Acromyrmex echinatior]|uniref:Uncharacterized protein n=1 Tax=Acromyrmex echinatior TaxID=103372 RepID=F4X6D9_ACREC|nr:hypothetical protein G5I_13957 [Acromyrmex echinatior]